MPLLVRHLECQRTKLQVQKETIGVHDVKRCSKPVFSYKCVVKYQVFERGTSGDVELIMKCKQMLENVLNVLKIMLDNIDVKLRDEAINE